MLFTGVAFANIYERSGDYSMDANGIYVAENPVLFGYIEINGVKYSDGEIIVDFDFYNSKSIIKFIPIPSDAAITSIEWGSTNIGDIIYYPNRIETPFLSLNIEGVQYLNVTVNGGFSMKVIMSTLI
jgi:hypothetical protein